MSFNTPPGWSSWTTTCPRCRRTYHESEGGCDCAEDLVSCVFCRKELRAHLAEPEGDHHYACPDCHRQWSDHYKPEEHEDGDDREERARPAAQVSGGIDRPVSTHEPGGVD